MLKQRGKKEVHGLGNYFEEKLEGFPTISQRGGKVGEQARF